MNTFSGPVQAIETHYKGYRFRSRLEARWAVFFDALGIRWEYEKEGFELTGGRYLPDFWLPEFGVWAEVKSSRFDFSDRAKCRELADATKRPCVMLDGAPEFRSYPAWNLSLCCSKTKDARFVLDVAGRFEQYFQGNRRFWEVWEPEDEPNPNDFHDGYRAAVKSARSARFEHGERP